MKRSYLLALVLPVVLLVGIGAAHYSPTISAFWKTVLLAPDAETSRTLLGTVEGTGDTNAIISYSTNSAKSYADATFQLYDVDLATLAAGKTGLVLGYGNGLFYDAVTPITNGVLTCPNGLNAYEWTMNPSLSQVTMTRLVTPSVRVTRRADYTHVDDSTAVTLDLSTNTIQKLVAVTNLTLTLANHTAGALYDIRITNSIASQITVTLASVQWEGFWPGTLAGNKVGRIWLECDADAPTTVYGSYAETP